MRDRLNAGGERLGQWFKRPRVRAGALVLCGLLVVGGAVGAYVALRTRPTPDYLIDDLDDVLDYTFLTAEFNRLSLEKRLALVKDLVKRIKGMGNGDSALMAAFAAGITGKAREQLQANIERLMIDIWDDFALRYANVPEGDRDAWLDNAFIEFSKMAEDIAGSTRTVSDAERLAEGKKNAQRDQERAKERDRGMNARFGGFIFQTVERGSNQASPAQRARMAQFSLEMTRHLRGQDAKSGKPE